LDFLHEYRPSDSKEAEVIIDKLLSRLSHVNPSVVFSTCKIIFRYMRYFQSQEIQTGLIKKMNHSMGTFQNFIDSKENRASLRL
jgi:AP-1 complex subunit beta-1